MRYVKWSLSALVALLLFAKPLVAVIFQYGAYTEFDVQQTLLAKTRAKVDALLPAETLIATNTSSISITKLAAATQRPDRFIGMHFFNPVPMMALVEIIRGLQTSDATHAAVKELAERLASRRSQSRTRRVSWSTGS